MRKFALIFSGSLAIGLGLLFACGDDTTSTNQGGPDSAAPNPQVDSSSSTTDTGSSDTGTGPGTDSGADTSTPFTPASLGSRIVLWLEGDSFATIDGSVVWPDKSGSGNNAYQDAATRMPLLVDAGSDGSVNGHGVVRFAGNEFLSISDSTSLQWADSDFGFYVVMRHENGPSALPAYAIVYGKWTDTFPDYPGFFMWANYPASTGYVTRLDSNQALKSDGGMNDGVARLVAARRVGSNYELRLSGNQVDSRTDASVPDASAFNAPGLAAVIGGRPATIQQLRGDIAEIIAVKGTLTDAEQTALEGYLKSKFGL